MILKIVNSWLVVAYVAYVNTVESIANISPRVGLLAELAQDSSIFRSDDWTKRNERNKAG